jgi:hypothetical protein
MKLLWVGKFYNRCDQLRALDTAARSGKKVDVLPSEILDEVMAKVATIYEWDQACSKGIYNQL